MKSVLFAIAFAILFGGLANSQIDDSTPPPLNKEEMVGEWEAITQLPLPTFLLRLEFRLYEPSFLVTRSVGSPVSQVFRLVSSEINDGHVKLRFRPVGPASAENHGIADLWIEGSAHGGGNISTFRAKMWQNGESSPRNAEDILFVKGAWTRDIATASKEAEEIIQEQSHNLLANNFSQFLAKGPKSSAASPSPTTRPSDADATNAEVRHQQTKVRFNLESF